MGQGIATSYAQLAVDVFGVPIEQIRILQGDTDRGQGFGSAGSRSLFTGGSAVHVASEQTVAHGEGPRRRGARSRAGRHRIPRRPLPGGRHRPRHRPVRARRRASPSARIFVDSTSSVGGADAGRTPATSARSRSIPRPAHVAVVAYASVNDIGRVVSPTIVRGQVDGGAVQGIGQALCERVVYDRESGQVLTGSFMDYALPRADMASPLHAPSSTPRSRA